MVYIPHSDADIEKMLKACGLKSIDELFDTIPDELKQKEPSDLQEPLTEDEIQPFYKFFRSPSLRHYFSREKHYW